MFFLWNPKMYVVIDQQVLISKLTRINNQGRRDKNTAIVNKQFH